MSSNDMAHVCRSEAIFCQVRICPFIWVLGIELRSPGLCLKSFYPLRHLAGPKYSKYCVLFEEKNSMYRISSWSSEVTSCARNAQIKSLGMEEWERQMGSIRSQSHEEAGLAEGWWQTTQKARREDCECFHHKEMQTRKETCQNWIECYKMDACGDIFMVHPHKYAKLLHLYILVSTSTLRRIW